MEIIVKFYEEREKTVKKRRKPCIFRKFCTKKCRVSRWKAIQIKYSMLFSGVSSVVWLNSRTASRISAGPRA